MREHESRDSGDDRFVREHEAGQPEERFVREHESKEQEEDEQEAETIWSIFGWTG